MKQLFARELCVLLRDLGHPHEAIADHLHVARSSVAGWAAGQRPVPHRYAEAFLAFVRAAIDAATHEAWATNQMPPRPHLLSRSSAQEGEWRLKEQLRRWEVEIYATTGRLAAEYAQHARTLLPYLHLDPSKLSREERKHILTASNGLSRAIRALAHLHNRPDETEGRILHATHPGSPVEVFDGLVAWWRAQQEEETTGDDREG